MKSVKRMFFLISCVFFLVSSSVVFSADSSISRMPAQNAITETVNINSSDAETLALVLNGIGMKRAESIVAYRTANGAFKTIDELKSVKGIGDAIVEKNKNKIRL